MKKYICVLMSLCLASMLYAQDSTTPLSWQLVRNKVTKTDKKIPGISRGAMLMGIQRAEEVEICKIPADEVENWNKTVAEIEKKYAEVDEAAKKYSDAQKKYNEAESKIKTITDQLRPLLIDTAKEEYDSLTAQLKTKEAEYKKLPFLSSKKKPLKAQIDDLQNKIDNFLLPKNKYTATIDDVRKMKLDAQLLYDAALRHDSTTFSQTLYNIYKKGLEAPEETESATEEPPITEEEPKTAIVDSDIKALYGKKLKIIYNKTGKALRAVPGNKFMFNSDEKDATIFSLEYVNKDFEGLPLVKIKTNNGQLAYGGWPKNTLTFSTSKYASIPFQISGMKKGNKLIECKIRYVGNGRSIQVKPDGLAAFAGGDWKNDRFTVKVVEETAETPPAEEEPATTAPEDKPVPEKETEPAAKEEPKTAIVENDIKALFGKKIKIINNKTGKALKITDDNFIFDSDEQNATMFDVSYANKDLKGIPLVYLKKDGKLVKYHSLKKRLYLSSSMFLKYAFQISGTKQGPNLIECKIRYIIGDGRDLMAKPDGLATLGQASPDDHFTVKVVEEAAETPPAEEKPATTAPEDKPAAEEKTEPAAKEEPKTAIVDSDVKALFGKKVKVIYNKTGKALQETDDKLMFDSSEEEATVFDVAYANKNFEGLPLVTFKAADGRQFTFEKSRNLGLSKQSYPQPFQISGIKQGTKLIECKIRYIGNGWSLQVKPDGLASFEGGIKGNVFTIKVVE